MTGCVPLCGNYNFNSNTNDPSSIRVFWDIDNNTALMQSSFNYCFNKPGNHSVVGNFFDIQNGCSTTASFVIQVWPKPQTAFSHYPESPEALVDEVSFTNLTKGNIVKSLWYFSKNPIAKSTQKAPMHTFQNAGINTVTLITVNDLGCSDTLTKNIEVLEDYHVYVPDVFTPNGDGLNDVFKPLVNGVRLYKIFVYNRSGKLIFSSRDETDFWDGTLNGNELEQGIYQWIMEVSTSKEEFKKLSGQVYLSR
ncbi:MAG: gliding motility-associated C-terminal domain-containing protein [Bacteroidia bacterium]